jgi:hypothetical protein
MSAAAATRHLDGDPENNNREQYENCVAEFHLGKCPYNIADRGLGWQDS